MAFLCFEKDGYLWVCVHDDDSVTKSDDGESFEFQLAGSCKPGARVTRSQSKQINPHLLQPGSPEALLKCVLARSREGQWLHFATNPQVMGWHIGDQVPTDVPGGNGVIHKPFPWGSQHFTTTPSRVLLDGKPCNVVHVKFWHQKTACLDTDDLDNIF
jgi:hypothetical protein